MFGRLVGKMYEAFGLKEALEVRLQGPNKVRVFNHQGGYTDINLNDVDTVGIALAVVMWLVLE